MAKTAKRRLPEPARRSTATARGQLRSLSARMNAGEGALLEGHVRGVDGNGAVRATLATGEEIEALCPAHIDAQWLREAAARVPVAAAFAIARPSRRYILWGLFPGPAHADVRTDVTIRGRNVRVESESLHLGARNAQMRLDVDGNVTVSGRDVTSHARRVNRIKGGAVRIN